MAQTSDMHFGSDNQKRAWYVIHTYSGYENKVKANLERMIRNTPKMADMLFNIVVPVSSGIERKKGQNVLVQRKIFPGYVLVDMIVDEHSWYLVRNTTGVTGFVGSDKHPIPLTDEEAKRILEGNVVKTSAFDIHEGDKVTIMEELYAGSVGTVTSLDLTKERVKVSLDDGVIMDVDIHQIAHV